MDITLTVKMPRHPGRYVRVLVRSPKWVADQFGRTKEDRIKGHEAAGWFQPSYGKYKVGTIAVSAVDLELVAHECTHCAFFLASQDLDEERICILTGELTKKVWDLLKKAEYEIQRQS